MPTNKALLGASLILAVAIVAASVLVKTSLDRGALELKDALAELQSAIAATAPGNARRVAAARRGPDAERRHRVRTDGAPARGPAGAQVTLVEFSDFQ